MLSPDAKVEDLTQIEFNCAYLRAKGLTRKEVAARNRITLEMVKADLQRVRRKLGTLDAVELRKFFEREGGYV